MHSSWQWATTTQERQGGALVDWEIGPVHCGQLHCVGVQQAETWGSDGVPWLWLLPCHALWTWTTPLHGHCGHEVLQKQESKGIRRQKDKTLGGDLEPVWDHIDSMNMAVKRYIHKLTILIILLVDVLDVNELEFYVSYLQLKSIIALTFLKNCEKIDVFFVVYR